MVSVFHIEHHVGKLVEVRIATPVRPEEMPEVARQTQAIVEKMPDGFVAVMDLRRAHVFPPEVAAGFIHILSDNNPKLGHSAVLIGHSAVFALQVERAIREAKNPRRKSFREPEDLEAWLDQDLDSQEQRRLHEFLDEESPPGA